MMTNRMIATGVRGAGLAGLAGSLLLAGAAHAQRMDLSPAPGATAEAAAATMRWETGGIYGGDVTALAVSPTEAGQVVAGVRCFGGLDCVFPSYLSTDLASSWANTGPEFSAESDITRARYTLEGWLFLAGHNAVRIRAPDGAWTAPSFYPPDLGTRRPTDLAFSRQAYGPGMMAFAASESGPGLLATSYFTLGLYEDTTPAPAVGLDATAVAMHPDVPQRRAVAFLGAQGQARVFVTTNSGSQWQERRQGLPAAKVLSLEYQGNRLLALVEGHGIYATQATQSHWTPLATGHTAFGTATRLLVSPHDPQTLWLATPRGLSITQNSGMSWQHQVPGTRGLHVLDISASLLDPDVVVVGVERWGALTSLDGGQSFLASTHGIQNLNIHDVAAHPANPRRMAAIVQATGAAWQVDSFDAGSTWQLGPWLPRHVRSLYFDGQGRLHALARVDEDAAARLYRLRDGRTWQAMASPGSATDIRTLHFDVSRPGLVRAAGASTPGDGGQAMVWTSHDDGAHWEVTWQGPSQHVATQILGFSDGAEDWLLVPTRHRADAPGVVAISADGGAGWMETTMGFPRNDRGIQLCRHEGRRTVFALAGVGVYERHLDSTEVDWGEYILSSPGRGTAGFACGDPESEELFVGSQQGINFWDPVLRRVAGSQFEAYHLGMPRPLPERATRLVLTPAGLFLGSEIGLFRNRAPAHANAPHSLHVAQASGRMARYVELSFQDGASWVRVLRDGEEIAVLPNTGEFRERRLANGSTPSYQVCNAFTDGCSEVETPAP